MHKKINSLVKTGFKVALAYRFHFYITLITSPLQLIVYYFLWNAIFEHSGQEIISGFTFQGIVAYYAINMIVAFFTWSNVDEWMEYDVRRGDLLNFVLKPIRFIYIYFFSLLGTSSLSIVLEIIPFFLIAIFIFGVGLAPAFYLSMFAISIMLALILNFLISYLVGMTAFWFNRISGIRRVKRSMIVFLSGGMIPLTFFPETFQKIFSYLPFQYIRFVPINIYLGKYDYFMTIAFIGIQLAWIIGAYILSEIVWSRAFRKFAGAGA